MASERRVSVGSPLSPVTYVGTDGGAPLSIDLYIGNHAHIQVAYGGEVAAEVVHGLKHYIRQKAQDAITVTHSPSGGLHLEMARSYLSPPVRAEGARWLSLDVIGGDAPYVTLVTSRGPVCLWLSVMIGGPFISEVDRASTMSAASFSGDPVMHDALWAARYRADMTAVAGVLERLTVSDGDRGNAEALALHWQPIRHAGQPDRILYCEALTRFAEADGGLRSASAEIMALERVGFSRIFDRHIVDLVIAELERTPSIALAANISAQSVRWDHSWVDIERRLRSRPDIARRLIIEVTETSSIFDVASAVRFVTHMRAVGCRIALDDFGAGCTSLRWLRILSPDIVKIDRQFLIRAEKSKFGWQSLFHLVRLANASGALVVMEGVEIEAQSSLASEIGIDCQQGYYWGRPSLIGEAVKPLECSKSR